MARGQFGGTSADFVLDTHGNARAGRTGTVWTAQTGGTQITDLLDADGDAVTTLTSASIPRGMIQFEGPNDGTNVVWVDFGDGRVKLTAAPRPVVVNATDYGAEGDRRDVTDAAITAGSSTLTSATAAFTGTDIGKIVYIYGAGLAGDNTLIAGDPTGHVATITAITPTTATLNAPAIVAVTGAVCSIGTDNAAAMNAANAAAAALGGGHIFIPRGEYMYYSNQISPSDNTHWVGDGMGVTILCPVANKHGFYRLGLMTGVSWTDLEVRCDLQDNGKAWYLNDMLDCRWTRCKSYKSAASGFGVDYLRDCWFVDCIAEEAGNRGDTNSAGCSGFGIGVGKYAVENSYFIGCVARNCTRYGIFFEQQSTMPYTSSGMQVIGGRYELNHRGIGDIGAGGAIIADVNVADNTDCGILVTNQSAGHLMSNKGDIHGCVVENNGNNGIVLDWSNTPTGTIGQYRVHNNRCSDNGQYGIRLVGGATTVNAVTVEGNTLRLNASAGWIVTGGLFTDLDLSGNRMFDNGPQSGATPNYGGFINSSVTTSRIDRNKAKNIVTTRQKVGIYVAAGVTITGGSMSDNDLVGNATSSLSQNGTIASPGRVERNLGYNPRGMDPLTPSASPYTYTAGPTRETIYLLGGTMSSVTNDGTTIYNGGANAGTVAVHLDPYTAVVVTYSVVPVAVKRQRH